MEGFLANGTHQIGTKGESLDRIERELSREFGSEVPAETIARVARSSIEAFLDARIKQFVPVLALRRARSTLRGRLKFLDDPAKPIR